MKKVVFNKITLEDIEKAIKEVGLPEYPQYIGNGLWKIADGLITDERGLEQFDKAVLEQSKKDYEEVVNEPSAIKIFDDKQMSIYVKTDKP